MEHIVSANGNIRLTRVGQPMARILMQNLEQIHKLKMAEEIFVQ